MFGIRVADCAHVFERLRHGVFESGAQMAAPLTVWPELKWMVLLDPSGNRIVVFEDALEDKSPRLDIFLRVASVEAAMQ